MIASGKIVKKNPHNNEGETTMDLEKRLEDAEEKIEALSMETFGSPDPFDADSLAKEIAAAEGMIDVEKAQEIAAQTQTWKEWLDAHNAEIDVEENPRYTGNKNLYVDISRIPLDSQGYMKASPHRYYGTGQKLWSWALSLDRPDGGTDVEYGEMRAEDKQDVLSVLKHKYPHFFAKENPSFRPFRVVAFSPGSKASSMHSEGMFKHASRRAAERYYNELASENYVVLLVEKKTPESESKVLRAHGVDMNTANWYKDTGRVNNPSLTHRITEAYKDVKHALTKKATTRKMIQRLKEAGNPNGAGGWPLVPSKRFAGEQTLACPKCGSTNVNMGVHYGPGGRLGSPGASGYNKCLDCKYTEHYSMPKWNPGNTRQNPESSAAALYEEFHGRAPGEVLEISYEEHEHETLTALGDLAQLKVLTPHGKDCVINVVETKSPKDLPDPSQLPRNERVVLASNEAGTQLYFIGGDQAVDVEALGFKGDEVKEKMVLGVLHELTYQTEKGFDNFQLTNYYHKLGEETGHEPVLLYDTVSQLLSVSGGEYRIEDRGIVN
jgi:predicted nucleic-acid-binding Zn-ribbon protein